MYFFKNALIIIKRNMGRNILLGIIIMVISCAFAILLSIRNSANKIVKSYESKNEIEVTISLNRNRVMEDITLDTES
ncbi:MAG: hypothetical protein IJA94_04640 [Bacilli bacterium]|nr:hypothetical protein [Bacilli bacterium]